MNIKLSTPRIRQLYGRQVAVATWYNPEDIPQGEISLVEILTKQQKGEVTITNSADVLSHLVLKLGVGA